MYENKQKNMNDKNTCFWYCVRRFAVIHICTILSLCDAKTAANSLWKSLKLPHKIQHISPPTGLEWKTADPSATRCGAADLNSLKRCVKHNKVPMTLCTWTWKPCPNLYEAKPTAVLCVCHRLVMSKLWFLSGFTASGLGLLTLSQTHSSLNHLVGGFSDAAILVGDIPMVFLAMWRH